MAYRIHDYVIRGEIRNSTRNSVFGWLEVLRKDDGGDGPAEASRRVDLSFTGNLQGELSGRDFRFEVREKDLPDPRPVLSDGFRLDQIGAMGDSVFRMVRVPLMPIEEFYEACKRGETPPEEQRASIYLEWYSQNGRVVLELLDPILEFSDQYEQLADPEPEPVPSPEDVGPPSFTQIFLNDDGTFGVTSDREAAEEPLDPEEDPYRLFPSDLTRQLQESFSQSSGLSIDDHDHTDENSDQLPRPRNWDELHPELDPETRTMFTQWDEVVFGTRDEPLSCLFESPLSLPKPDDVRDEQHAWSALSSLLAAMALRGVAFDMCPHFSALQAYRLLIEELLPEAHVHPDLVKTGWTRHYSSWESCPQCEAEFDDEFNGTQDRDS